MFCLLITCLSFRTAMGFILKEEVNSIGADENNLAIINRLDGKETGKRVSKWNENMTMNPEEMGQYFEGDIVIPFIRGRNGLFDSSKKWEGGIIPYVIRGPYTRNDLAVINKAMEQYHKRTCIRFRRKQPEDWDYISIQNTNDGCWSYIGKIGGAQDLNLQSPGCLSTIGTPVHEFMHALGFYHEQSRYDRDDYVNILWKNIDSGNRRAFEKVSKGETTSYGVNYDYGSVMHYSEYAFSKNEKPTIISKTRGVQLGQRNGFSDGDVTKIRKMYNCGDVDKNSNTIE